MTYDPQIGDKVLTINAILRNAFHLHLTLIGKTEEDLKLASGQIFEQVMHWLGDTGYGVVTELDPENVGYEILEINDPKVNKEITITIPENVGCVDNRSQFIGQLN